MSHTGAPHEHPSPHRARTSAAVLLAGLAVGPAAWAFQQLLGYGVSNSVCFPADAPTTATPANWPGERLVIVAASVVFLLIAFSGVWIALRAWRATREEKGGRRSALLDIGEGRSRFLALCGVLAGSLFCLAIVFDLAVALGLRSCGMLGS